MKKLAIVTLTVAGLMAGSLVGAQTAQTFITIGTGG